MTTFERVLSIAPGTRLLGTATKPVIPTSTSGLFSFHVSAPPLDVHELADPLSSPQLRCHGTPIASLLAARFCVQLVPRRLLAAGSFSEGDVLLRSGSPWLSRAPLPRGVARVPRYRIAGHHSRALHSLAAKCDGSPLDLPTLLIYSRKVIRGLDRAAEVFSITQEAYAPPKKNPRRNAAAGRCD